MLLVSERRRAVVWSLRGSQSDFTTCCREFTESSSIMLIRSHTVTINKTLEIRNMAEKI